MYKLCICILMIFVCCTTRSNSIEEQFRNNTWLLKSITINNIIINSPENSEISQPTLIVIDDNSCLFQKCAPGFSIGSFSFVSENQILFNEYVTTPVFCQLLTNEIFFNDFDDFINLNLANQFTIQISEEYISPNQSFLRLELIIDENNRLTYYNSPTASNNDNEFKYIKLFPNPVSDFVEIDISGDQKELIESYILYDVTGNIVLKGKLIENKIDLRYLKSGFYFLCFNYDRKKSFKKIKIIKN